MPIIFENVYIDGGLLVTGSEIVQPGTFASGNVNANIPVSFGTTLEFAAGIDSNIPIAFVGSETQFQSRTPTQIPINFDSFVVNNFVSQSPLTIPIRF
jgi:hypothetical protein